MRLLEFVTARNEVEADSYTTSVSLQVKERRTWLTNGANVIEGRVWQHAEVVIEAKHLEWDRENETGTVRRVA
jgi:hypothetical protein